MMGERAERNNGMSGRMILLRKIQQLNFAMIELGLYMNNRVGCEEAEALYDRVRMLHNDAKKKYEEKYGPLTYEGVDTEKDGWSWVKGPWPWEGEC